jgi:hypothetical protein
MEWNGVGVLTEVQGLMNADQYCQILDGGVVESFEKLEMPEEKGCFSRTMTPNIHSTRQPSGLKTTILMSWSGHINPIEHLWMELKKVLKKYPIAPKEVYEL